MTPQDLGSSLAALLAAELPAAIEFRHDLHRHAELSGAESRTAAVAAAALGQPDAPAVAGTGRLLSLIEDFRFGDAELDWLRSAGVVRPATIDWLADFRFRGTITGYPEGDLYFPGSPILVIHGGGKERLLPAVPHFVLEVDSAGRRVVVDLPDDLPAEPI